MTVISNKSLSGQFDKINIAKKYYKYSLFWIKKEHVSYIWSILKNNLIHLLISLKIKKYNRTMENERKKIKVIAQWWHKIL